MSAMLEVDETTGAVVFGGRMIGELTVHDGQDVLIINAGWARLAGLGFRIDGDSNDRRRTILDRSDPRTANNGPTKRESKQTEDDQLALNEQEPQPSNGIEPAENRGQVALGIDF